MRQPQTLMGVWYRDDARQDGAGGDEAAGGRGDGAGGDGVGEDGAESDVPDFDPADWAQPPPTETRADDGGAQLEAGEGGPSNHGDGDGGGLQVDEATNHGNGQILSVEQAADVYEQNRRLQRLEEARRIVADIGGVTGVALANTVKSVMHAEAKRWHRRMEGNTEVICALRKTAEAEEAQAQQQRLEFQENLRRKRETNDIGNMQSGENEVGETSHDRS